MFLLFNKYIVYITSDFKTFQVKWIFVFVFSTPFIQTLIRRQLECMVNSTGINSAQSNFLEYHLSSSNITRCQVPSRVRAWFHDSAGDIDFNQIAFIQSEYTCIILHESINNIL